jgi:hypothetical protein
MTGSKEQTGSKNMDAFCILTIFDRKFAKESKFLT